MQTPGEVYLIQQIIVYLKKYNNSKIINVGAGISTLIEEEITNNKEYEFSCDRIDINDCSTKHPSVNKCYISSAENMSQLKSNQYNLAFSNYVLEHIPNLAKAAKEIGRILKKDGVYIASISNPSAPEFRLAKYTPLAFHQMIKGKGKGSEAYETYYNYKNIKKLINIFENNGFKNIKAKYYSFTYGYLYRFPVIRCIGRAYDYLINKLHLKSWQGNVCLIFKKN